MKWKKYQMIKEGEASKVLRIYENKWEIGIFK